MVEVKEQYGIDGLKAVVKLCVEIFHGIVKSMADSKMSASDIWHFTGVLPAVGDVIVHARTISAEIKDLSGAERQELKAFILEQLASESETIRGYVRRIFDIVEACLGLFGKFQKDPA